MKPTRRTLVVLALAVACWFGFGRRRVLTWGAEPGEARASLPGDELLADPDGSSTRAITVNAPPAAIWPWLVQIGPAPRGGAYTYDWIENLLGLGFHSTDHILDEYQDPQPGLAVRLGGNELRFERIDRERTLAIRSTDGSWLWSFNLVETGDGRTRLISRNRYRLATVGARIGMLFLEAGSLVMERRMLIGIRDRAERLARTENGRGVD